MVRLITRSKDSALLDSRPLIPPTFPPVLIDTVGMSMSRITPELSRRCRCFHTEVKLMILGITVILTGLLARLRVRTAIGKFSGNLSNHLAEALVST